MHFKQYLKFLAVLIGLVLIASCGGGSSPSQTLPATPTFPPAVSLASVVTGLDHPVDLQFAPDNSGRLFVVSQSGTIRIVNNGNLLAAPFLDIQSKVIFSGEMGLLGLAFHPDYARNGHFYVNYVRAVGGTQYQTIIAEYRVSSADPNLADASSERILLTIDQPFTNHKGGQLAFGPDGFLYIGLGDGGSGGDPLGNAQNLQTLLGKMLRIDVDHMDAGLPYAIPSDNPFVNSSGLGEIWAYGFRNPWRFSFERGTGRLFSADVGQANWEEIDLVERGNNYGWNIMEGSHCYPPGSTCDMSGLTLPIAEYDHSDNRIAVIGGYVYKGSAIPALADSYIMGDFGSGTIWALKQDSTAKWNLTVLLSTSRNISSFGQDAGGDIYVADYGGSILKLVPQ